MPRLPSPYFAATETRGGPGGRVRGGRKAIVLMLLALVVEIECEANDCCANSIQARDRLLTEAAV